ncbi:MAG: hypothetical protein JW795_16720 [Chitinivibrionales bacterium]|nr:hypothetical protein [Chitinivibrionales bacterium]
MKNKFLITALIGLIGLLYSNVLANEYERNEPQAVALSDQITSKATSISDGIEIVISSEDRRAINLIHGKTSYYKKLITEGCTPHVPEKTTIKDGGTPY